MAEFVIPVGDTTPVLELSLKIANSDPVGYWDGTAHKPDGVAAHGIHHANFVMINADTLAVVIAKPTVGSNASHTQANGRTVLRYAWLPAAAGWPTDAAAFPGDTGIAGSYRGEFEVTFNNADNTAGRKRTFPCTPGDELIITVTPDLDGT